MAERLSTAPASPASLRLARAVLLGTTALLPLAMLAPARAQAPNAVPTGGQVTAGQALIQQQGTRTQITQGSERAVIDWQRFDVGRDATVNFTQPSQNAWTLNRVNTPDPSLIAGRITANGGVAIVNPSGVVFAQGAQVNVGSLVASAAGITNQNFMAGRMVFDGAPNPGARIENRGEITVADRGLAALVAPGVANHGTIRARLGTAIVAGAETYRLDLAGDGLLSIDVTQAVRQAPGGGTALVTNTGVVAAEGGQVILTAQAASGLVEQVVRNTGQVAGARVAIEGRGGDVTIAGGAVTAPGGRVDITAPGAGVTVAAGARVSASGAAGGGQARVGGNGTARTRVEGRVAARGTGPAARGGQAAVQASGAVTLAAGAVVDASGPAGGGEALVGTTGIGRAQAMARETRLEAGAAVRADATARGDGGVIAVNSAERTAMAAQLSARGGEGGNGGFVEVSGMRALTLAMSRVDVGAGPGGAPGTLLIDPRNIIIRATAAAPPEEAEGVLAGGGFATDGAPGDPTTVIIAPADIAAFGGHVTLEAQDSLTVASAITMPANSLTLITSSAGGGGITVSAPINVQAGTLTLTSNSFLAVDANMAASGGINMNVTFGIGGAGGVQTPGVLRVRGFDGTDASGVQGLNLAGANAVGSLDLIGSAATVTFAQAAPLVVDRAQVGPFGGLTLGSGGLISGGNVTAGDLVIRGAALGSSRAGGLDLVTGVGVTRLDARTSGATITLAQTDALTVVQADAGAARVTLGSGGLISGGGVVANELVVLGATLMPDSRAGGLDLATGNLVGALNARTEAAALTFTQAGALVVDQANARTGAGTGTGTAGGTVTLTLTGAGSTLSTAGAVQGGAVTLVAGGDMALAAPVLATLGDVALSGAGALTQGAAATIAAAEGRDISLRFASMGLGASVSAGATGTVRLVAPGARGLVLGSSAGTELVLDPATLATRIPDGTLRLEAAGDVVVNQAFTRAGPLVLNSTGGAVTLDAAVNVGAGTLGLDAAGNVTGTGAVTANLLRVRGADGADASRAAGLDLSTGAHAVASLDARVANAALRFAQAGALGVTRADAGTGNVTLGSNGVISGGGVVGDRLTIRNAALNSFGGGLDLTASGNAIATLDAQVVGGNLAFAQVAGFAVTNAVAAFANVTLGADGVITGSGAGGVDLTIRGAGLGGTRAGGLDLRGNFSGRLDARTANAGLTYAQNNGFAVTGADAGTGDVTLGSNFAITGGGVVGGTLTIRGLALGTTRAGGLDLATGNAIATLDARTNGALRFAQATGFALAGADAGAGTAGVTLGSDGIITGGGVVAGTFTLRDAGLDAADGRAGGLTLTGTNAIAVLDARTAGTALSYSQGAGFEVRQANARTGAGAGVGAAGAAVTLSATDAGAALTVPVAGVVQGGTVTLRAPGTLTLEGPVLATQGGVTLALTAPGGLLQQGAGGTVAAPDGQTIALTADRLTLGAAMTAGASGLVEFTRASPGAIVIGGGAAPDTVLDPAGLQSFLGTGHLRLISSDGLTVQSALTRTTGELTLRATQASGGGIAVNAALDVGTRFLNLETPGAIAGAGVITTGSLVARADMDFLSRAGSVSLTGNNLATRLNARTAGGGIEFRNAAPLRVTRIDAMGPSGGGTVGITLAGAGLLLEVANDITAGQLTLLADNMAIAAGSPALIIPGGAVRLLPFTAGRGVTLGGEVAGTLSLSTAELAAIGGAGADGTTNPATVLRIGIGRSGNIRAGDITVAGPVDLTDRVLALELFAGGNLTGSGAIRVGDLGAVAGGNLVLDGDNAVARLAPITDTAPVNGAALGGVSLWGGTRNSDPLGLMPARQADRLEFRNAGLALDVAGSVLASGSGGLRLESQHDGVSVAPGRWVTAEAGPVRVHGGLGVLNQGTIHAQDLSGGSVSSGLMSGVTNAGAIILGCGCGPADASFVDGWAGVTNGGLMVAGRVGASRGAVTNAAGAELRAHAITAPYGLDNAGLLAAGDITGWLLNTGSLVTESLNGGFNNQGLIAATAILGGSGGTGQNSGLMVTQGVTTGTLANAATGRIESGTGQATLALAMPGARAAALAGTPAPTGGALALGTTRGGSLGLVTNLGDLTNAGVIEANGNARLAAAADLTLAAGAVRAAGSLELAAGRDVLLSGGSVAAGGALRLGAGRDARLTGGSATAARLGDAGVTLAIGRDLDWRMPAPELFAITTGRDLRLSLPTGPVGVLGSLQAGRDLVLAVPDGALALGGATLAAGGALAVRAGGAFTALGTRIVAGTALRLEAAGDMAFSRADIAAATEGLAEAAGNLGAEATALTTGGTLRLAAGGALTLAEGGAGGASLLASTGGDVVLAGGRALTATGAGLTAARNLALNAGAAGAALQDVTATAQAGGISLVSAGAASIRNASLTAAQGVDLQAAGAVAVNPSNLVAGGALRLASGGALDVTGGTMQSGLSLRLVSGGAMRIAGTALTASTAPADAPAAFQPLRLQAGGDLSATGGTLRAERAELVAAGALTTAGSAFAIGSGVLLSAPGGIGQPGEAATRLDPLDASRLPLVIMDTRQGVALTRLPDALTPATTDRRGLSNRDQRWQVPGSGVAGRLVFGADDGTAALPGGGPGGPVALNLDIGDSPLFVLLDGGTANGSVQAGRLGVFGRPGAGGGPGGRQFDLRGRLSGVEGVGAARFGLLSGPLAGLDPLAGELSQYRFNDCVLSTVNCVAPPAFTLPAVPQANTLVLVNAMPRFDDSDVLLPNVADEDY